MKVRDTSLYARVIIDWLKMRVSYRGGALLTFAFIDFVIGFSLIDSKPNTPSYDVIELVPYPVWAALWILVGLVCAVQAFARYNDAYGFAAAAIVKFVWSIGFAAAWVIDGAYRAWVASATWLVIGFFVLLISGWPDPVKRRSR